MATHTNFGGNTFGRKFSISRENGQANKEGIPHFFEWLPELPDHKDGRKFETRVSGDGKSRHYELFKALDGYLVKIETETKTIENIPENWLVLSMVDVSEDYRVEVGKIDSRYSMDIMKRLLDPNFDANQKLRLSPYAIKDNVTGKWNIGLAAMSGVDGKLYADPKKNPRIEGIAQPATTEFKGEKLWDFSPVAGWLIRELERLVMPGLFNDPISAPKKAQEHPAWPEPAKVEGTDDLPF